MPCTIFKEHSYISNQLLSCLSSSLTVCICKRLLRMGKCVPLSGKHKKLSQAKHPVLSKTQLIHSRHLHSPAPLQWALEQMKDNHIPEQLQPFYCPFLIMLAILFTPLAVPSNAIHSPNCHFLRPLHLSIHLQVCDV